jgi:hypothetical protein
VISVNDLGHVTQGVCVQLERDMFAAGPAMKKEKRRVLDEAVVFEH